MSAGPDGVTPRAEDKPDKPSPVLPHRLRVVLPALVALDAGLLLTAHVLQGASTEVNGSAPFGMLSPHTASSDNLMSAAKRLANAHAWACVAVVVGLSGLWPYMKLALTLSIVGAVDTCTIKRSRGRRLLQFLEVAGKYSFADVFLICFNFVIFDISTGGSYRILGAMSLELNMWMQLHFAPIGLIIAVTVSTFLTRWAAFEMSPREGEEKPLLASVDAGEAREPPPKRSVAMHACAMLVALVGGILLIVGAQRPMIRVERGGFLGNLIRPEEDRNQELSVMSIFAHMLAGGGAGPGAYNTILAAFWLALTVVAPLLEFVFLAADAIACRMATASWASKWTAIGAEWAHSFGCVDVLLIVAAVLLLELHTVVEFNIGDECAPFESMMSNRVELTIAGLGFATSDECFTTGPSLGPGSGILAAVILFRFGAWRLNDMLRGYGIGHC
mmetsp:Transcript_84574/g.217906  ORF Transcript_84574/g.217906 Transcript_84574/m.217906 type:complete len:445 (+) Transcript_84574:72-1406(+)